MSISEQIERIINDKTILRTKVAELGIGDGTENLDALTEAFNGIENKGAVSLQVKELESTSLEAGYYTGISVTGVPGGGNYANLESVERTPTKSDQIVTPGTGFYALEKVTIKAIPAAYQIVTGVTATENDVLSTAVFVDSECKEKAGKIDNLGTPTATIDGLAATSYKIEKGYYEGGTVSLTDDIENALADI